MTYLNAVLEPGDRYINKYSGCMLPNDRAIKDPDKLRELSGPVKVYYLEGGERDEAINVPGIC